ncbi:hypothetical protein MK079_03065 [Candidatus Gracilibacteria bacterium]|nr:hypothetical protein [Candidatus Gracilibacteria bacterium]
MKIKGVIEYTDEIFLYLRKRRILRQYNKVVKKLIAGQEKSLKIRQPKNERIYYFRINKQYRAYGKMKEGYLVVFAIDNHQNG